MTGPLRVELHARTEGSSLAYRVLGPRGDRPEGRWQLYTGRVRLGKGQRLEAVACRLGFEDSSSVSVEN